MASRGGPNPNGGWDFRSGGVISPDGNWNYNWGTDSGSGGTTFGFGSSASSSPNGGGFGFGWGSSTSIGASRFGFGAGSGGVNGAASANFNSGFRFGFGFGGSIRYPTDQVRSNGKNQVKKDIVRLKDIQCYRGIRHSQGLPCRGHRMHTNARTWKGKAVPVAGKKNA